MGVHTPVTMPSVADRVCVALISTPTANRSGPAQKFAENDPNVSPMTTYAPPCNSIAGWRFPTTGMVATARSTESSTISMPIRSLSSPTPRRTAQVRPSSARGFQVGFDMKLL